MIVTEAAARTELAAVLEAVLPGRVYPYPPTSPAPVAPAVYVTTFDGGWRTDFEWAATFQVRLIADGANHAAYALLDDMVANARAAIAASDDCYPGDIRFEPFDTDAVGTLPAYTFNVLVDVAAETWPRPDLPSAVQIPPIPITRS